MTTDPHSRHQQAFETRAIHAASPLNTTRALTPPIFQSSTFKLASAAEGAELSASIAPEAFYTRWGNPTTKQAEATIANLEGAEAGLLTSSGMGAISTVVLALLSNGDHVLAGKSIYSGTLEIARGLLSRFGVDVTFVDAADPGAIAKAIRPETKLVLLESPTNPTLEICDLRAVAEVCRGSGVVTVADNTFATPWNQNPLAHGIDVVVHAATKGLGGHSDLTAGVILSSREIVERCWSTLKVTGCCLSPFESWLLLRSLKTLAVRVERQNATAQALAEMLERAPQVRKVHYPGLPSHPRHDLARRQMRGFGSMLSFELRGGLAAGRRCVESLRLVTLAVSLGGAETIVQHPASMSHSSLSEEELRRGGIEPGLLRLSVGLEAVADLKADLEQALARAGA